eukprot:12684314-Alexandrium_andersonii.AAC.1
MNVFLAGRVPHGVSNPRRNERTGDPSGKRSPGRTSYLPCSQVSSMAASVTRPCPIRRPAQSACTPNARGLEARSR